MAVNMILQKQIVTTPLLTNTILQVSPLQIELKRTKKFLLEFQEIDAKFWAQEMSSTINYFQALANTPSKTPLTKTGDHSSG